MIATISELKALLNIDAENSEKDSLLFRILEASQKFAENYTGRKSFEFGEITTSFEGNGASFWYSDVRPIVFDFENGDYIKVDGEIVAEEDISFYETGKVELLNGFRFTEGKKIEMRYFGGFIEVPQDLKNAVLEISASTYRDGSGVVTEKKVGDFTIKFSEDRTTSFPAMKTLDFYRVNEI